MRKRVARLFLIGSTVLLVCLQSALGQKCEKFVSYDKRTGNLSFKGFGISTLSAGLDTKSLQVASDLTQIFDQYRVETCDLLNRNKNAPDYQENVRNSLEATARLTNLMALLQKGKVSDNDIATVIDSVPKGKELQKKVKDPKIQAIPLQTNVTAANPEFEGYLKSLHAPVIGSCAWDLFSEEQKKNIGNKLVAAPGLTAVTQPLNINLEALETFLFLPCSDGRLHVALSYIGGNPPLRPETVKIQRNYGFVGVAYATQRTQSGVIPDAGFPGPSFVMGTDAPAAQTQEAARRLLLEPEEMKKIKAKWVIAVPVKNQNGEVNGVISFSSAENPPIDPSANPDRTKAIEQLLDKVANSNSIERLSEEVASALASGK